MKKAMIILLVGVLVLSGLGAVAVSDREQNVIFEKVENFSVSNPIITRNERYCNIDLSESTSYIFNEGEPVIPKVTRVYTLPVGSKINDVSVSYSKIYTEKLDYEIRPAPQPVIEGDVSVKELSKDNMIYSNVDIYPKDSFNYRVASGRYEGDHVMFLIINCYPVRYLPSQNLLISYNDVDVEFTYEEPPVAQPIKESYDLLIIAPRSFESTLQPFVEHKNGHGISTELEFVEDIYAEYTSGYDDPENIKLFIKDEFDEHDIKYVLLVGGQKGQIKKWYIPVRNTNNHAGSGSGELGVDSDLYYADLYKNNGTEFDDWDSNGNKIYAEFTGTKKDIIDGIPEVFVGRLACRSKFELRTVLNKIMDYENVKADDSWFKNMLLIGGDTYPEGGNYLGNEAEIDTNLSASYMTGFEFERLWASNGGLTGQKDVEDAINDGSGFIHMAGHANPSLLVTHLPLNESSRLIILRLWNIYNIFNFNPHLRNRNALPVVVIGGCHNSQFNVTLRNIPLGIRHEGLENYFNHSFFWMEWVPECFSWWLTSKPNGGFIAAMGNTGLGMGLPGEDYVNGLDGWLFPRFFYNYGQMGMEYVGEAHSAAITDYVLEFDIASDDAIRQMVEQWPLLGDPSMLIGGYD